MCRAILPKVPARLPIRAQAFVMPSRVLNNDRVEAFRVREDHPETNGAAIIVQVKRVTRQPERFREMIHGLGDVIERIGIVFWIGPVALSEAGIVGGHEMKAIGQTGEKRFELPRGSWEAV